MIEYKSGNLLKEFVEALVNPVNCVGVMGKGLALQFKRTFPDNFYRYEKACFEKKVQPGRMFVVETGLILFPKYIINFPTKRHWRDGSRLEDIKTGLTALVGEIKDRDIDSIAIPALGCGYGGLAWENVKPLLESTLGQLSEIQAIIFEPF